MPNPALVVGDHWADPGGRSLDLLEQVIEFRTGEPYSIDELVVVCSVEEMRKLVFSNGVTTIPEKTLL